MTSKWDWVPQRFDRVVTPYGTGTVANICLSYSHPQQGWFDVRMDGHSHALKLTLKDIKIISTERRQ